MAAPAPFDAPADVVVVDDDDDVKTIRYPSMSKTRGGFTLNVVEAEITNDQIILLHGQPHTGKTTFLNILAGQVNPDTIQGELPYLKVSYKTQRIRRSHYTVKALFRTLNDCGPFRDPVFVSTVVKPLQILPLLDQKIADLSDAQLQSVALCLCLARNVDIYFLDEPTASLDPVQRGVASQVIKGFIQRTKRTAFVIERNPEVASYLADRVIVFQGVPSVFCVANPPIVLNEHIPVQ